ncbi:MAG: mRNA interferase MazF9 [Actinomycetia bacterium]|nr:mRNA interferase MazF9 [Actinomycetes bacterium]
MRRGDVHLVSFDPAVGSESNKTRPALIVSNDGANRVAERLGRGVVVVVPITSSVIRVFPFQLLIPAGTGGLERDSKTQTEQLRTVDVTRIGRRLGTLPPDAMATVNAQVRQHLAL